MTSSVNATDRCEMPGWLPVGAGDFAELAKARLETFNLMQWLARVGNSTVECDLPEQRTELQFCLADGVIKTRRFGDNLTLALRLPGLNLQFLEYGRPAPHAFDPHERSPAQVEAWILVELLHRGIEPEKFSKRLPYQVSGLMSGDEVCHSPRSCGRGLVELTAWLQNAAAVLEAAARAAGIELPRVVVLPQTLALACIAGAGRNRTCFFGFQPGDDAESEPYFYRTAGSARGGAGDQRAILKACELRAEADPAATAMRFLRRPAWG